MRRHRGRSLIRLLAREADDRWRTLESAPKDGRLIFLRRVEGGQVVEEAWGYFGRRLYMFDNVWEDWSKLPGCQREPDAWVHKGGQYHFIEPTHWRLDGPHDW